MDIKFITCLNTKTNENIEIIKRRKKTILSKTLKI